MDGTMNRFDEIKELIRANPSTVKFADFGNGVAEGWIAKAEEAIGMRFPASYRWWLENCSGGEIGGEEIFSVYEEGFDTTNGGNVVSTHRIYQKSPYAKTYRIPICHSDIDGVFISTHHFRPKMANMPFSLRRPAILMPQIFLNF